PLGVLVEHRVDDVDECLVTREETVSASQQIALKPSLALMLAQHLHYSTSRCKMVIPRIGLRIPGAVCDFEHVLPPVRVILVRAEETEVAALHVELHHVAEKPAHHPGGFGRDSAR